jgi:hypothetical protein
MESKIGIHANEESEHETPIHFDLSFRTWSRDNGFGDQLTIDQLDTIWGPLASALYLQLRAQINAHETKKNKIIPEAMTKMSSSELLKDEIPF